VVQAFSRNLEPQPVLVQIGIWGEQCDRPPL